MPQEIFSPPRTIFDPFIENFRNNCHLKESESGGGFTIYEDRHEMIASGNRNAILGPGNTFFVYPLNGGSVVVNNGNLKWVLGSPKIQEGQQGEKESATVWAPTISGNIYKGRGFLCSIPRSGRYHILERVADWPDGITIAHGSFVACPGTVKSTKNREKPDADHPFIGNGYVCIASKASRADIIEINLKNDKFTINSSNVIAYSTGLTKNTENTLTSVLRHTVAQEKNTFYPHTISTFTGTGKLLVYM